MDLGWTSTGQLLDSPDRPHCHHQQSKPINPITRHSASTSNFLSTVTYHMWQCELPTLVGSRAVALSARAVSVEAPRAPLSLSLLPQMRSRPRPRSRRAARRPLWLRADMSSTVLEGIARLALQSQLKAFEAVEVGITSETSRLLQGALDGVVVRGKGWQSPLGLSARLLEVQVGLSKVDIPKTLQTRNIQLDSVPQGQGRVRFTADDFASFLRHPLMQEASSSAVKGQRFDFDPSTVSLSPGKAGDGSVRLAGVWAADEQRYTCTLQPQGAHARVTVLEGPDKNRGIIESELSSFYSNLTVELQGAFFTFSEMRVARAASTKEMVIDLKVQVRVEAFPPLNQLAF